MLLYVGLHLTVPQSQPPACKPRRSTGQAGTRLVYDARLATPTRAPSDRLTNRNDTCKHALQATSPLQHHSLRRQRPRYDPLRRSRPAPPSERHIVLPILQISAQSSLCSSVVALLPLRSFSDLSSRPNPVADPRDSAASPMEHWLPRSPKCGRLEIRPAKALK